MPYVPVDQIFQQDPEWLKQNYPQSYSQYVEKVGQPGAGLQQTQTSTAATGAQIPGITAESGIKQVQQQQITSPLNLSKDLASGMTLKKAISKYTAPGGMKADDVFKQYLAESPYGIPKEDPTQLQNLGVSPDALGKIGVPGSFMDRYNTRNAITELRSLENQWDNTSGLSHLPFLGGKTVTGQVYDSARTPVAQHIQSLIPGAPAGQTSGQELAHTIPDVGSLSNAEPGAAHGMFTSVEQKLLEQKGYTPQELGITPRLSQILNQGNTQQPQSPKQNTGSDLLNGLLETALPVGGAIGGGILGGMAAIPTVAGVPVGAVAGAGLGGAAGQKLTDLIEGKKPGTDVPITGAFSAAGEGAGALLGRVLGKAGAALATKVPDNVFNKVISASPNYTTDIATLKSTANKYNLMGGSTADGLAKMPSVMNNIGKQIQTGLAQVKTPVNISDVNQSILKDFEKQTNAFENSADFENAKEYITKRLYSGTGNDNPLSTILMPNGEAARKAGAQTTYSALYNLKSEVANDLKPVFKAQANPAANTNFTPKQEANLALWSGLKTAIDKADPNIRVLNDDQHNMFDIAKGFVKHANTGKGGNVAQDVFGELAGAMAGPLGPLGGLLASRVVNSEGGKVLLSKILQSGMVKKGLPVAGSIAGSGLGAILGL